MCKVGLKLTVDGTITDFLGMSVKENGETIELTQPLLTKQIMSELCTSGKKRQSVPMAKILQPFQHDQEFDKHFD